MVIEKESIAGINTGLLSPRFYKEKATIIIIKIYCSLLRAEVVVALLCEFCRALSRFGRHIG